MRLHTSVFLLASLTAILACGDEDDSPAGPLNTYRVVPGPALAVGQDTTAQATATVRNETANRDLTGAAATYSSADTTVATVSLTGLVKGIRPGTTNIIARFVDQTAQIPVTVRANPSGTVTLAAPTSAATDFRFRTATAGSQGDVITLSAVVRDADGVVIYCNTATCATSPTQPRPAFLRAVEFTSSDTLKAVVSSSGAVTARDTGAVTITMREADGKTATVALTIRMRPLGAVSVTAPAGTAAAFSVNQTVALSAAAQGTGCATTCTLAGTFIATYVSDDPLIASVDENGVVTARAASGRPTCDTTATGGVPPAGQRECRTTIRATIVDPVSGVSRTGTYAIRVVG